MIIHLYRHISHIWCSLALWKCHGSLHYFHTLNLPSESSHGSWVHVFMSSGLYSGADVERCVLQCVERLWQDVTVDHSSKPGQTQFSLFCPAQLYKLRSWKQSELVTACVLKAATSGRAPAAREADQLHAGLFMRQTDRKEHTHIAPCVSHNM